MSSSVMKDSSPQLGVCYYPEHWPEERWSQDARQMAELGISWVRIGEFAWSRLEPSRGNYQFDWLQRAIETLYENGLKVVLGTPSATPPIWLVDEMPDMLPVGRDGLNRNFGSRRHYSFSHSAYRAECIRIVTELGHRFGKHPAVQAWQVDNEYDCHNTARSYSATDLAAFQNWLAEKYRSPDALNKAWGNVFWSMEYSSFKQVELPNQTVTEANPSHWMDFYRFASDMVAEFNKLQVEVIRKHSPDRPIIHNFMGRTLSFDHYRIGADIDISSWDSYPLGFLEEHLNPDDECKLQYQRSGHPDFQAFHHDLYRSTSAGRWWVMEQQPGPVNWAKYNPIPRAGMVYLWTMEAFAHGAEVVSYFRWRQAHFAQEQMHSGLLRVDGVAATGFYEAQRAISDIKSLSWPTAQKAKVAILFDYQSAWAWEIQPQGASFDYFQLVFEFYEGLRSLGVPVDFIDANAPNLDGYQLVLIPGLFCWNRETLAALDGFPGEVVIGPRSGSKTNDFQIPNRLPPDLGQANSDLKVITVESLRPHSEVPIKDGGAFCNWREIAEFSDEWVPLMKSNDGHAAILLRKKLSYLCGWPNKELMRNILSSACKRANIRIVPLPEGIRMQQIGELIFVFNYGEEDFDLSAVIDDGKLMLGEKLLRPSGVTVFQHGTS